MPTPSNAVTSRDTAFYIRPERCSLCDTRRRLRPPHAALSQSRVQFGLSRMKITIFGANGGTGRWAVQLALQGGHTVVAVTRHPESFPFHHVNLTVVRADVFDIAAVKMAIGSCDVVLSTLGVRFAREKISLYSAGTANIVAAMKERGIRRLAVVSSAATYPHEHEEGGIFLNRVLQPLITATIGRTTYDDMRRMEELVRGSDLDWTILRPSGLFNLDQVTEYRVDEERAPGVFTARIDLAACLVAQITDSSYVQKNIAVTTISNKPTLMKLILSEALKKE